MTLPRVQAGQIWQMRDQSNVILLVSAEALPLGKVRLTYQYTRTAHGEADGEVFSRSMWEHGDAYCRLESGAPGPMDLVNLLYDPSFT